MTPVGHHGLPAHTAAVGATRSRTASTRAAAAARALRTLDAHPATVVVVGGPAADDEAMAAIARVLPEAVAVGLGDVAGVLGPRFSVAYGLAVLG